MDNLSIQPLQHLMLEDVEETGRELGRGAYGVVFEVKVSGLLCAGKKIHDIIAEENIVNKFVDECLCHSQQRHPNIVQLIGVYLPPSSLLPMLIMEYLPLSLMKCLDTQTDLPLDIKYSIILDVANGLNYLHRKKPPIVHRDLTACNVLLTGTYIAKISDLGVTRIFSDMKRRSLTMVPGNSVVMPPEAFQSNPQYDHKLDVFSYGCLILHVFTHKWPQPNHQFSQVLSEWDRRLEYAEMMGSNHPMLSVAKECLKDEGPERPDMNAIIELIQLSTSQDHVEITTKKALPGKRIPASLLNTKEMPIAPEISSILPPPLPPHHYPGTPPVIRRTQQFSSDSSPGPLSPNVHFFRSELPPPLPPRGISHYPGTPPITRRTHPFCSDSFPGRRPPSHSLVDHYHYNTPPIIQRTRPFSSESSLPFRPRLDTPKKPPPIPPRSALPSSSDAHKWFYHTLSHESAEAILIKYHRTDGSFLVRVNQNCTYLSLYMARSVDHIRIYKDVNGLFSLESDKNEHFSTLNDLVLYYQTHPLFLKNGMTFLR